MSIPIPKLTHSDTQRFLSKIKKTEDCWIWKGAPTGNGYGGFWLKYRNFLAHRISWFVYRGDIPDGLFVLHDCPNGDNKFCVNPNHLWLGTSAENMKDAGQKGQMPRGEEARRSKLKAWQVNEIRALPKTVSHRTIMLRYGISKSNVSRIRRGLNWRHLL